MNDCFFRFCTRTKFSDYRVYAVDRQNSEKIIQLNELDGFNGYRNNCYSEEYNREGNGLGIWCFALDDIGYYIAGFNIKTKRRDYKGRAITFSFVRRYLGDFNEKNRARLAFFRLVSRDGMNTATSYFDDYLMEMDKDETGKSGNDEHNFANPNGKSSYKVDNLSFDYNKFLGWLEGDSQLKRDAKTAQMGTGLGIRYPKDQAGEFLPPLGALLRWDPAEDEDYFYCRPLGKVEGFPVLESPPGEKKKRKPPRVLTTILVLAIVFLGIYTGLGRRGGTPPDPQKAPIPSVLPSPGATEGSNDVSPDQRQPHAGAISEDPRVSCDVTAISSESQRGAVSRDRPHAGAVSEDPRVSCDATIISSESLRGAVSNDRPMKTTGAKNP